MTLAEGDPHKRETVTLRKTEEQPAYHVANSLGNQKIDLEDTQQLRTVTVAISKKDASTGTHKGHWKKIVGIGAISLAGLIGYEAGRSSQSNTFTSIEDSDKKLVLTLTPEPTTTLSGGIATTALQVAAERPTETVVALTPIPNPQRESISQLITETVVRQNTPEKSEIVPDSVWPGGIEEDKNEFTRAEAITAAEVYNGTTTINNDNLRQRLSAARAYAESIFGVRGTIDTNTLTAKQGGEKTIVIKGKALVRTSDTFWEGKDEKLKLTFREYEVKTPPKFSFKQIAVMNNNPGRAYVNNNSVLENELLYVIEVSNEKGEVENTVFLRSKCGNIGREEKPLPKPTKGATVPPLSTPTQIFERTPVKTVTEVFHPSDTPQPPKTEVPTVTPARTQPPQATRTPGGSGATPEIKTPFPTSAPVETTEPIVPQPSVPSATPSF